MMFIRHSQTGAVEARQRTGSWGGLNAALHTQLTRLVRSTAMAKADHGEPVDIDVAGRTVTITSPGKVMFPERGETKLDLANYYVAVGEPLMRTVRDRPTLLQRWPERRRPGRTSSRSGSPTARPTGWRRRRSPPSTAPSRGRS